MEKKVKLVLDIRKCEQALRSAIECGFTFPGIAKAKPELVDMFVDMTMRGDIVVIIEAPTPSSTRQQ